MNINEFSKELTLWNKTHNLISKHEIINIQEHIIDSESLIPFLEIEPQNTIIDIGSGGGFPIIPIAFWNKSQNKNYHIIATDLINKKLSFLKWCNAKFELNMEIIKVNPHFIFSDPCIITSRAFSSIKNIITWQKNHAPNTKKFLLLKGNNVDQELKDACITKYQLIPNPRGFIVLI